MSGLVLLLGCDSGTPKVTSPVAAAGSAVAPADAKVIPPGPYVIKHGCSHSNQPFGTGGDMHEITVDLAAQTEARLDWVYGDTPTAPRRPPPPTVTKLDAARLATITADLDVVLRGGPFPQVEAVPEGISCSLEVSAAGTRILILQRSPSGQPIADAVADLVHAL